MISKERVELLEEILSVFDEHMESRMGRDHAMEVTKAMFLRESFTREEIAFLDENGLDTKIAEYMLTVNLELV